MTISRSVIGAACCGLTLHGSREPIVSCVPVLRFCALPDCFFSSRLYALPAL